ncbi:Uncharacterised protein [Paenibacillus thiaminolyticus]|nr:Uncharacterised protein [Paenibacillus thiaminolyticus]
MRQCARLCPAWRPIPSGAASLVSASPLLSPPPPNLVEVESKPLRTRMDGIHAGFFIFRADGSINSCMGAAFYPSEGRIGQNSCKTASFRPQIPSNPAQTEEIAADLQDFLFPDLRSRKKLQNCSFGRSGRRGRQASRLHRSARTSLCFRQSARTSFQLPSARNVHVIATFYS